MVMNFHAFTKDSKAQKLKSTFFSHFIKENENGPKVVNRSVLSCRPPESQITSHTALENTDGQRKLSSLNNEVVSFLRRSNDESSITDGASVGEDLFLAVWGLFGISFAKSKHYTVSKISGKASIISVFSIRKIKLFLRAKSTSVFLMPRTSFY